MDTNKNTNESNFRSGQDIKLKKGDSVTISDDNGRRFNVKASDDGLLINSNDRDFNYDSNNPRSLNFR